MIFQHMHSKRNLYLPCYMLLISDMQMNFYKCRYAANKSMDGCAFCNADGDFLIVPQKGSKCSFKFFRFSVLYVTLNSFLIDSVAWTSWSLYPWFPCSNMDLTTYNFYINNNFSWSLGPKSPNIFNHPSTSILRNVGLNLTIFHFVLFPLT